MSLRHHDNSKNHMTSSKISAEHHGELWKNTEKVLQNEGLSIFINCNAPGHIEIDRSLNLGIIVSNPIYDFLLLQMHINIWHDT